MSAVTVYRTGLVHCSVCAPADMDSERLVLEVNGQNPTGITSPWAISEDDFSGGQSNPCPCEQDASRLHYLMVC